MDQATQRLMSGAAGAGDDTLYVEDAFCCHLYTGNGGTNVINNGIDLAAKGGLVIIKKRFGTGNLYWFDTNRGVGKYFVSNQTNAPGDSTSYLSSFNSNGFTLGGSTNVNQSGVEYVSWTFRQVPGNFTMTQYTGTGSAGLTVSHDLGRAPQMMMVRSISGGVNHLVMGHHKAGDPVSDPGFGRGTNLSGVNSWVTASYWWNNTAPTSSQFTLGHGSATNSNGATYIAYLWSNDSGFGEDGNQQIYGFDNAPANGGTGDNGSHRSTHCEPQFLAFHSFAGARAGIHDKVRGITGNYDVNSKQISWNDTQGEQDVKRITIDRWYSSLGWRTNTTSDEGQGMGVYWYVRSPDKLCGRPPEVGTDNFDLTYGTSGSNPSYPVDIQVDWAIQRRPAANEDWYTANRKSHGMYQKLNSSAAKVNHSGQQFDFNTGWHKQNYDLTSYLSWTWAQGHGFDVGIYSGRSGYPYHPHNLREAPQMVIMKNISDNQDWYVWHYKLNGGGNSQQYYLKLNSDSAEIQDTSRWNNTVHDQYYTYTGSWGWTSYKKYLVLTFSSIEGISKLGQYTGNGGNVTVNLGFTPRFFLAKKRDGSADWVLFDSVRGIGSNSARLRPNKSDAQYSNMNAFSVSGGNLTINNGVDDRLLNSSGNWIYYAHA